MWNDEAYKREKRKQQFHAATIKAKKVLKKGDKVRGTKCPGTKRWFIFDHWDGSWIVSKSGIDDYAACNIDRVNDQEVDFTI